MAPRITGVNRKADADHVDERPTKFEESVSAVQFINQQSMVRTQSLQLLLLTHNSIAEQS